MKTTREAGVAFIVAVGGRSLRLSCGWTRVPNLADNAKTFWRVTNAFYTDSCPNLADKREDFLARDKRFLHRLVRLHEIGVGDDPLGVLALLLDHTLQCRLVQLAVG